MKITFPRITVLFAVAALVTTTLASAEDTLSSKMGATATLDAKTNKLTLVLKGKEAGVYVNTEFGTKCTLTGVEGGTVAKAELTKADATFEDAGKPGKAKSATFSVGATKKVRGECRMVACSDSSCSAPFTITFTSN